MIALAKIREYRFVLLAFFISLFFHLYRLGHFELQGDEASGFLVALKMSLAKDDPKMAGHLFLFGHTPLRVLLDFFAIFCSHYSEFLLRFPNALFGALSVFPFYKIAQKTSSDFSSTLLTLCYATLGLCFGNRIAMGVGPYVFFQLAALYYLLKFMEQGAARNIYLFAAAIFLSIMTYAEGSIFFIPFLLILFFHQTNFLEFLKRFYKVLFIFLLLFIPIIFLWFFIPYYLFTKGQIESYAMLGGFRILARATSGASNHLKHNYYMMRSYVGSIPHLFFMLAFIFSIFLKFMRHSRPFYDVLIWFLIPAIYFHFFVSDPTNHMQFYYSYFVILGAPFFDFVAKKLAISFVVLLSVLTALHSFNIAQENRRVEWGPQITQGLRPLGQFVREHTRPTDMMYLDGVEGYVARIYFGLSYSENITQADIIITADQKKSFESPWKLTAQSCAVNIWQKREVASVAKIDCGNLSGMEEYWQVKAMLRGFLAKK